MKNLNMITGALVLTSLFTSCDKNEFAPVIYNQEFSIAENSPEGTLIGQVEAYDPDEGQVLFFEIIDGNDEGICTISSSGSLLVSDPANLDYESITEIVLTISVSDRHKKEPFESSAKVEVNITDVNEFTPEIVSQEFTMDENPINGQEIGLVSATDQDSHQILYYQIAGPENEQFVFIDSITGMLYVLDSAVFDYETNPDLIFTIKVRDNHENSLSATKEITIHINNISEEVHYVFSNQPDGAAGKDAVISSIVPDNNYADLPDIMLYAWTQGGVLNVNRTVIDFGLSDIPPDARIDSAYISLYFNTTSEYGSEHVGETSFIIKRATSDWDESTVTWNSQPSTTATHQVTVNGATQPTQDFPHINISSLIQDYISNPQSSYGFLLKLVNEDPFKILLLASSDHSDGNLRPKIEVYYTIVE